MDDWTLDCLRFHGRVLTGKHKHWCPEWDYLPLDETCDEFDACTCTNTLNVPTNGNPESDTGV